MSSKPATIEPAAATDCAWLLHFLSDGEPHTLTDILRASFDERGCGLTVHSRVAELRTRYGRKIAWRHDPGQKRGRSSVYQLVGI